MAELKYVDWDGLVYYDGKIKPYIADKAEDYLKMGGVITFDKLPDPSYQNLNYIYKITDEFVSNSGASETLKLIYDELKMISEDGIHFVDTDIDTLICYALDLRAQAENLVDELRSLK